MAALMVGCAAAIVVTAPSVAVAEASHQPPSAVPAPMQRTVVVYGDSIVHAAAPFVHLALAREGVNVIDASVGGTSPCDALQFVKSDMARYSPAAVVIAYVGNTFSPCINGTTGAAIFTRHYADTQRLVDAIGQRPILLDTPPGNIGQGLHTTYDVLVDLEAAVFGARVVDTGAALIDPATKRFEKSMPCFIQTICKRIDVRGSDGYHLTLAGAYRYSQVLTRALLSRLGLP
jgi:hypothetical protein